MSQTLCKQCTKHGVEPHICEIAQVFGPVGKCCTHNECYSLEQIVKLLKASFGVPVNEPYFKALVNSSNVGVD